MLLSQASIPRSAKMSAVLVTFVWLIAAPAIADIFTWTDAQGVRHFSNEPPAKTETVQQQIEIPPDPGHDKKSESEPKEQLKKMLEASPNEGSSSSPTATPRLKKPAKVVIYTTPTCGYCKLTRAFLSKHKIAYTDYDITTDSQAQKRYRDLNGNGVPLIFIGDQRINGYNEYLLRRMLDID
jgi:glutaredoxin